MKRIRSLICFVITIILIMLLFTACFQIMPPVDNASDESVETAEEGNPADKTEKPDNEPMLTPTAEPPQPGVVEMFLGEPISVDLYGDGTVTEIKIFGEDGTLVLQSSEGSIGNALLIADIPAGYLTNAYYVKSADGYPFVVVSYDYISDDFETSVFTFDGFEPHEEFKLPLYVSSIDEFGFETYGYLQAIGTWAASASAYFVADTIDWRGTYVLDQDGDAYTKAKTVMNLPVQILQDGSYIDKVLAPGTVMSFVDTDGDSYVSFVLEDGTEGYIIFEWDSDWIELIDGVNAYEYFEELPLFG